MKWLITGGSGFTGRFLSAAIMYRFPKDEILILDINPPNFALSDSIRFNNVNLLDKNLISKIIEKEVPDRIIHLAALMRGENPFLMTEINVLTCGILAEAVHATKIKLDGFLIVGSAAQYGIIDPDDPPTEKHPCYPYSFYGQTKLLQERLALEYNRKYDLPIICTRPANLMGPYMPSGFVITDIIDQLIQIANNPTKTQKELILNHVKAGRDFIDVRDVSNAYISLLENQKAKGEIFNISQNRIILLTEIIEIAKRNLGIKELLIIEKFPKKQFDLHCINSEKLKLLTSWKPEISVKSSIIEMISLKLVVS